MQVIDFIRVISLYSFAKMSDNCCMSMKNTDAQVKAQIISNINNLRSDAEFYGYDYPTDANLESENVENLREFLRELSEYILDGVIAEMKLQQSRATH